MNSLLLLVALYASIGALWQLVTECPTHDETATYCQTCHECMECNLRPCRDGGEHNA